MDHEAVGDVRINRVTALRDLGRNAEAQAEARDVLATVTRVGGTTHQRGADERAVDRVLEAGAAEQ